MIEAFKRLSSSQQSQAVTRACTRNEAGTIAAVIRTAQDFAEAQSHPSLRWLDVLLKQCGDVGSLMRLADAFPSETLVLREHAVAVTAAIAERLCQLPVDPRDSTIPAQRARILNNLSVRLSDLGRREEGLAAIEEAVAIRRDLAAARPDAFLPDLAGSLNNLSASLSDLGRREEGLAAIEEAVAIRRDLAAARPDAFRANLARSLSVLGDCLEAVDRLEAALAADCESVVLLTVDLTRRPQAHAGLMAAICQEYLRHCEKAGVKPDEALLAPVIAVFQQMQGGEGANRQRRRSRPWIRRVWRRGQR